ncbi:HAD family hydrolase [Capillimicrobium parvum]|uniref:Phosphatase n=1 Tax=Capillimicrobium parvum TaxID=2884022 RepID=A0A9E7C2I2_9ACTN|nr:HAD family phosphatase [Capillimicrobium parvum]UGS37784.1 Phosphatase [Capillimicrobium parvum]
MSIEAVVTDWGGVLTSPMTASFVAFAEDSGFPLEALGEAIAARTEREGVNPVHRLEVAAITEQQFLDELADDLAALGHAVRLGGFAAGYFDRLSANAAMIAALEDWKARGFRLALCTNNVAEWEPHWRAMLPVDELFEVVVDSAFVGARKPDPRIYEIVVERLGLDASACVFVDDRADNCEGARAAGMHAVHFVDTAAAIAEIEAALKR